jgi:molybdopterin-guanine dinucleotide biosynthesis protein A
MRFSAVILAGGRSSRMGCDKAWLEMDGQPLLARQIRIVREAGVAEVLISGRAEVDYAQFQLPVLLDPVADQGPLAGIERALSVCAFTHLLVLAVDLPRMSSAYLQRLMEYCSPSVGVVPRLAGHSEPLVAIYPKDCLPLAQAAIEQGEFAVRDFALNCSASGFLREVDVSATDAAHFDNWNQPSDFKAG